MVTLIVHIKQNIKSVGSGVGLVVSVLAFYSDDPSSNPTGVYIFSAKLYLKERK